MEFFDLAMIGVMGGMSHLLLTESYRHAPASVVAPFDYTAMIWAFLLGYFVFGELPSVSCSSAPPLSWRAACLCSGANARVERLREIEGGGAGRIARWSIRFKTP